MAEPQLSFISAQTETTVTIDKTALPGLTAAANNSHESIMVAMLLAAAGTTNNKGPLHPDNWAANPDQSLQVDVENLPTFSSRQVGGVNRVERVDTISIALSIADTSSGLDPDNY